MSSGETHRVPGRSLALVLALLLTAGMGTAATAGDPGLEAPRMIVVFDRLPGDAVERLRDVGITHAALFPAADAAAVLGPTSAYRAIGSWSDVVNVYPEMTFSPLLYQSKVQIGVDQVHAGAEPLRAPHTGEGVTVAVVDTGMLTSHPDLDDRVALSVDVEPSFVLDAVTDGEYSRSYAEGPVAFDDYGHGTFVAGILAGSGDAGMGTDDMRGVAPGAVLVNIKFGGVGQYAYLGASIARDAGADPVAETLEGAADTVYETSALAAYQWIIDHKDDDRFPGGIRVVSNSWGGPVPPPRDPWGIAMTRMLWSAVRSGITVVFAAGNNGPEPDTVTYPGSLPWLITVGMNCKPGTQNDGFYCGPTEIASLSSRGPEVDVVAPGVDIWTASPRPGEGFVFLPEDPSYPRPPGFGDPASEANNRTWYGWLHAGTSLSAPHVSGIVALMLEANPNLNHAQIERILQKTATDLGPKGFDEDYGYGQVNAFAAVSAAERLARTARTMR